MRQTELEKPVLFGVWRRTPTADRRVIRQVRDVWVDGTEDPVAVEHHVFSDDGTYQDWVALLPGYWKSGVAEKLRTYLKATRPELFRKPRVRKERKPPQRDETGKFIKKEVTQ